MMEVWPFRPRTPVTERLQWLTDVMQAKSAEQRVALRGQPRVMLEQDYALNHREYEIARNIVRDFDRVYMPLWQDRIGRLAVDASSAGLTFSVPPCSYFSSAKKVLVWRASDDFEVVDFEITSSGGFIDSASAEFTWLLPVFEADILDGIDSKRRAGHEIIQGAGLAVYLRDAAQPDGGAIPESYMGLEVLTDCPKIGVGDKTHNLQYQMYEFDNSIGEPQYSRKQTYPKATYAWRWVAHTPAEKCELRRFMSRRKGCQKAFWVSDYVNAMLPVSTAGTALTVEDRGYLGSAFDIEIKNVSGALQRLRVTATERSSNGWELTLSAPVAVGAEDIKRISKLHCVRLNSDEVVFAHHAGTGVICSATLTECPIV